ncbi:ribosome biogenesis protein Nop6 [Schizosaccharomyces cryophilus OY26]|uniref:Ribosome biogenesis protein Nop6 n=1 Tax=Schizosaccharomyces cryophilus (strain OY26 / ATCC MYA-4695 / CBS 11777 / NBRC 106824 / NRRL Y48691) TaxID=653667 RepID=S9W6Q1_SCHCR|nr:ribosome biogenesis protein Nop6 [Schizosaccharomyces cryophilus OY26]EPY54224.1 ribosome biogenesis protein Nop6 [Schizosaccharomyces cryophilus OY26]
MDITKRVFVGGLSSAIQENDLKPRFSRFGTVTDFTIVEKQLPVGTTQKFAYVTFQTNEENWTKCKMYLSKATFKGSVLKVEEAKPYFKDRLNSEKKVEDESSTQASSASQSELILPKDPVFHGEIVLSGKHAKDMNTVSDADVRKVPPRKGWKKGPYGRAIVLLNIYNKKSRKVKRFYPLGRNCLQKLWGKIDPNMDNATAWYDPDNDCYLTYSGKKIPRSLFIQQAKQVTPRSKSVDENDFENRQGAVEAPEEQGVLTDEQLDYLRQKEKDTANSVLAELFGQAEPTETSKKESEASINLDNDNESEEHKTTDIPLDGSLQISVPQEFEASEKQAAVVNVDNLKEMFTNNENEAGTFSLFGGDADISDENEEKGETEYMEEEETQEQPFIQMAAEDEKAWPMLFPTSKSSFSYFRPCSEQPVQKQALESWWNENRLFLTRDYKRKRKDALKRLRRAQQKQIQT